MPFINKSILFFLVFTLTACTGWAPDDFGLDAQQIQDKNKCKGIAQAADTTWREESLEQLYSSLPNQTGGQKTSLYRFQQVLKACEGILSTRNFGETAEYLNALRDLEMRIADAYIEKEKKLFLTRTNGKVLCDQNPILINFFFFPTSMPKSSCLYTEPPNYEPITAIQATQEGALLTVSSLYAANRVFFLYNDNPTDNKLVDGAALQPGYFIYTGIYRYTSLTGPRSVSAFRRIPDPSKDILFYNGH